MRVGYARVSTDEQTLDLQLDALQAAGCTKIFQEHASGARAVRDQLTAALEYCRDDAGDILVVWKLDRLGRSLKHLLEIIDGLQQRQIGFQVLTGVQFDTTTPHGRFALQLFAAMAEYERALIHERVMAGLAAARARGRKGGRRPKLSSAHQRQAQAMARDGIPITEIAQTLQCSRHTVYKALAQVPSMVE